eukprot:TRINITY_DN129_c0_g1_i1.p1 TRINITY_DN129_c0_g1~~TRINITY_DN129_c0_g1_i1.p1  ORF type:complete len:184 (-),score=18.55 TRINITY_DN129_c0_g1_i1:80-631(-)
MKAILVIALLCAAFACALADERYDFVLEYRGHCGRQVNGNGECELKGQSEQLTTRISGDGRVRLEVTRLIGSISRLRLSDKVVSNSTYSAIGNVTFGVHLSHENHKLHLGTVGYGFINVGPTSNSLIVSAIFKVLRGEGALAGAYGTVVLNGVLNDDSEDTVIGLMGAVWVKKSNDLNEIAAF